MVSRSARRPVQEPPEVWNARYFRSYNVCYVLLDYRTSFFEGGGGDTFTRRPSDATTRSTTNASTD